MVCINSREFVIFCARVRQRAHLREEKRPCDVIDIDAHKAIVLSSK